MKKHFILTISLLIIAFLIVFYPAIPPLIERFTARDSYYSHGFIVPFITFYLVYRKKRILQSIAPIPCYSGLVVMAGGLVLHIISQFFKFNFGSYLAIPLVLLGIVLFLCGKKIAGEVFMPLCFLIFMLPLPHVILIGITFRMKLLASVLSSHVMNYMGLKTVVEGSRIIYHGGQLWVGDPCSGLRSLISFLALGTFVVQISGGAFWKKTILFVSTVPIALFSNIIRIIILTFASYIYGEKIVIMVFILGFSGFILMMGILKCGFSSETV